MQLTDFDFELPPTYIAQSPASPRDHSKLMVIDKQKKTIAHHHFYDLPSLLPANTLMIRNNSKVIKARLTGTFSTGSKWELFFISPRGKKGGLFLVKPGKKFQAGTTLSLQMGEKTLEVQVRNVLPTGERDIAFFNLESTLEQLLEKHGELPLPPYIDKEKPNEEQSNYQTIYAKKSGSVAAPTAGLHFTKSVEQALREKGIDTKEVTLHVGLGTFLPVKEDDITKHHMHEEHFSVEQSVLQSIVETKQKKDPVMAVGTTSTRVLEHIFGSFTKEEIAKFPNPYIGSTDIFIYPPYTFKAVDMLLTNFHLPKSTLLMLVSSFIGDREFLLHAYEEAKKHKYRFFSYGDAMLIL